MKHTLKNKITRIDEILSSILFSPITTIRRLCGLPFFLKNLLRYNRLNKDSNFKIKLTSILPMLSDRFENAGGVKGHYFLQDLHVAELIFHKQPKKHVDVGSRIDGFIAHLLTSRQITYVDLRNLPIALKNLEFQQGSITNLPFDDNELESLSSLHVIEHIGLGRYGDPVDPIGHRKASHELQRVTKKGGLLYLSTPVGKERLCYDAHRVFSPQTIVDLFSEMKLIEFYLIDDTGDSITLEQNFDRANNCDYGCGIFIFQKI